MPPPSLAPRLNYKYLQVLLSVFLALSREKLVAHLPRWWSRVHLHFCMVSIYELNNTDIGCNACMAPFEVRTLGR